MIAIKSAEDMRGMREAGALLKGILDRLREMIRPGVDTLSLDKAAEAMIRDGGALPSFLGYEGYPHAICASADGEVVHGMPSREPLIEGQIISIDAGLILRGWQADSAFTVSVGRATEDRERLIRVTEECFWLAVDQAREGKRVGDIGWAVQGHAEANGYGVIRAMCGHGIGREMHEEPSVPNFGAPGRGVRLKAGMTLAIEPMISMGGYPVYRGANGWTIITRDGSPCSHYEHTVAVTSGDPEILTLPGGIRAGAAKAARA